MESDNLSHESLQLLPEEKMLSSNVEKHPRDLPAETGQRLKITSPYSPISLLETVRKFLEKILFSTLMTEIISRVLMRDEQFGDRPKSSMILEFAGFVESVK